MPDGRPRLPERSIAALLVMEAMVAFNLSKPTPGSVSVFPPGYLSRCLVEPKPGEAPKVMVPAWRLRSHPENHHFR
jgi:hypothetical protein